MAAMAFSGISHLDLSVSDVEVSAAWYERVLDLRRVRRVDFPERAMVVLSHEASGLVVGLNEHRDSSGEAFDERRSGLDHVGFAVDGREDLDRWETRLATLGVEHSRVTDTEVGAALVFRDPDHIQLELWWSKPRDGASRPGEVDAGLIERSSPDNVGVTVQRLTDAAIAAGLTVFAIVDHSGGAHTAGLDMPETQVLLVGNPRVGTPAMLAAPDLALELPTRLLVRQGPSGTPGATVVFRDPAALARRYGLSAEQSSGLEGVVGLLDRALRSDPRV